MDELIGLVAVIGIFIFPVAALGTGWVILLRNRHEERIKMIDKGVILAEPERSPNRYPALRNGLFMVGLAIGLIVGMFVEPSVPENDFEFIGVVSWFAFFVAIEHLGELELAATNVIRSISTLFFIIVNSLAATTGSLVSNLLGKATINGSCAICIRLSLSE